MQYNLPDLKPEIAQLESDIFALESTINKLNAILFRSKDYATQQND